MRKNTNSFFSFLKGIIVPFLTVFAIASVSILVYRRIKEVAPDNDAVVFWVIILTIFVLSIAFAVADKFQRKITTENPVNEILEATDKIAHGDFSVRLNAVHAYDKYNDFDLIKENLNKMVEALENSEILKTDFIANVSHELKTPLAIIQNYAFLLKGETDEETVKKYVSTIISATKRLNDLVSNVLKLNKLENQPFTAERELFRLDELLAESVLSFEDVIDKKGLDVDCDLKETEILSSRSYLEIVFTNLLSNAIKFTDEGGSIRVRLTDEKNRVKVEITDTGCGISPETGAHIFDKFYQGDTSHSGEGNGLGLALVKKIIDLLGGEISVKSELSKGSTFTVTLNKNL